jgi:hypothetical protein
MNGKSKLACQRIDKPGRYAVTLVCADDLTDDEIIVLEARIEAKVCLLQRQDRGYDAAQVAAWA